MFSCERSSIITVDNIGKYSTEIIKQKVISEILVVASKVNLLQRAYHPPIRRITPGRFMQIYSAGKVKLQSVRGGWKSFRGSWSRYRRFNIQSLAAVLIFLERFHGIGVIIVSKNEGIGR